MSNNRPFRFTPLIIAISLVAGILIGAFYSNRSTGTKLGIINSSSNKINALLRIIESQYVDSVNMADLVEKAVPQLLSELDPHSTYIPAQDMETANAELEGSFSGIGIQFNIQDDTVHVNSVIHGGPSEKVGLMAGDRIISVDDTSFVGKHITPQYAPRKLKGPKGSQVKLGILRPGEKETLTFVIERGDIPVKSVDAAYMIDPQIGYIKINKFGRTTYMEMLVAIAQLRNHSSQGLIIDLRGNTGGYMDAAIKMVSEFLSPNELIVYTEGRQYPREEYYSIPMGSCEETPLVVLIDEGSASASEIFAGAIQDNDRGTLIGRRSFGKGLVQQSIDFSDGSAIRLTVARYYTPSGRCIQKPYDLGENDVYEMDILNRYEHGEFFSEDSIQQDTLQVYHTALGRTVYGGGGIMPDIFVPQDTTDVTTYYSLVANRGLPIQFAYQYTDQHRKQLSAYTEIQTLQEYLQKQGTLEQFIRYAEGKGIKRRNLQIQRSRQLLERSVFGNIIYNMLGFEAYIQYANQTDPTVEKALQVLREGESWPVTPTPTATTE